MLARALAAALAVAASGCHQRLPGGARCPDDGGAEWREHRSAHFVLDTDLAPEEAAALLHELERLEALVAAALAGAPRELPGYVRVVVPARDETYRAVVSRTTLGFYTATALGEPLVVLHPSALRRDPELVAHEVAHHVAWHLFPRQPRWFAEGLAQFAQTVASEAPGGGRAAGLVPARAAPRLAELPAIPAARLLAWRGGDGDGGDGRRAGEYQLWSWVLYHWLWSERPRQLGDFEARLVRGEDPARAWRAAFPALDPERPEALAALDAALDAHRRAGALRSRAVRGEPAPAAISRAPLAAADVHLLLLDVRRNRGALAPGRGGEGVHRAIAEREVEAALRHDPAHPVALAARARLRGEPEVPALRRAAAARPGDWRAWLLLADALERGGDPAEREEAYRRAVALNPASAPAQAGLAGALAAAGRTGEALAPARRAVELAPWSPGPLSTLAWITAERGRCDEARALAARAADVGEGAAGDETGRRLRAVEARCGGPGAGVSRASRTPA